MDLFSQDLSGVAAWVRDQFPGAQDRGGQDGQTGRQPRPRPGGRQGRDITARA